MDETTKARLALALPFTALAIAIVVGWWMRQGSPPNSTPETPIPEVNETRATGQRPSEKEPGAASPFTVTPDIEVVTPAISLPLGNGKAEPIELPEPTRAPIAAASLESLNQSENPPEADLLFIQDVLKTYRAAFRENPFGGENEEIVAGLTGRNARSLVLLPPDHPAIDEAGRLLDRWGTPYHFHPISREVMDVTSAGPDHQLFTEDDVSSTMVAD